MEKIQKSFQEESGSVMVITAGALMVIIMFMALVVDLGLYYSNYRKLKSTADFVNEEVRQTLPYYAYANDYQTAFRASLLEAVDNMGYSEANIIDYKITRKTVVITYWTISVSTEVNLQDKYQCVFLGIIGVNEFPIYATSKRTQTMPVDQPYYEGMPFDVWGDES